MTAAELIRALLTAAENDFPPETAALYAPDAVIETPFSPGARVMRGAEIATAFAAAHGRRPFRIHVEDVVMHETMDPHVAVAEVTTRWTITATGHEFVTRDVRFVEERGGVIVAARDYHDHAAIARELAQ